MITSIKLNNRHQDYLNTCNRRELEELIAREFPLPLALSYRNFSEAVKKQDSAAALMAFTNDLTTNVLHFLSLVLASEYINNASENPASYKVYQAIENMTYRPGPGKWLGFLREIYYYYQNTPGTSSHYHDLLAFVEAHEIQKKPTMVSIEENHGNTSGKKFGFLECLVSFRNSFAHSKTFEPHVQQQLMQSLEQMAVYLYGQLSFMSGYELYCPGEPPVYFKGYQLPDMHSIAAETGLWIHHEGFRQELFPLIIYDELKKIKGQDLFMLESLQDKRIFYSSHTLMSEKRKDRDPIAEKIHALLKQIEAEPEVLDAGSVTAEQLHGRFTAYAEQVLSEYELNGKFHSRLYVLPRGFKNALDDFTVSDKCIVFLSEDQGAGKSAFCASLASRFVQNPSEEPMTVLIDSRTLDQHGKIPGLFDAHLRSSLGLKGDLITLLDRAGTKFKQRFRFVIDNLNEYFLKGTDQSYVLDQLMDFTQKVQAMDHVQIIAIARPEYYDTSFAVYRQPFEDKIKEHTFMPQDKVTLTLPALELDEVEQIWKNYAALMTNCSPLTAWSELSDTIKEHCRKPLIMLFLLRNYDNREIPGNITLKKIKKQYIKAILDDKETKKTLFDLLKKMHDEGTVYLLTDMFDEKEIRQIADSSINPKTKRSYNDAYNHLVDIQLIREEKVKQQEHTSKKISVNNEMTLDVVSEEKREWEKKEKYKSSLIMIFFVGLFAGTLFIGTYFITLSEIEALFQDIRIAENIYTNKFSEDFNIAFDSVFESTFVIFTKMILVNLLVIISYISLVVILTSYFNDIVGVHFTSNYKKDNHIITLVDGEINKTLYNYFNSIIRPLFYAVLAVKVVMFIALYLYLDHSFKFILIVILASFSVLLILISFSLFYFCFKLYNHNIEYVKIKMNKIKNETYSLLISLSVYSILSYAFLSLAPLIVNSSADYIFNNANNDLKKEIANFIETQLKNDLPITLIFSDEVSCEFKDEMCNLINHFILNINRVYESNINNNCITFPPLFIEFHNNIIEQLINFIKNLIKYLPYVPLFIFIYIFLTIFMPLILAHNRIKNSINKLRI
jgi:hypothetical protein